MRRTDRRRQGALDHVAMRMAAATEGTRNDTLNTVSLFLGRLVAAGVLDEDEATETLHEAGDAAGLDHAEVRSTVRSGLKFGMAEGPPEDSLSEREAILYWTVVGKVRDLLAYRERDALHVTDTEWRKLRAACSCDPFDHRTCPHDFGAMLRAQYAAFREHDLCARDAAREVIA